MHARRSLFQVGPRRRARLPISSPVGARGGGAQPPIPLQLGLRGKAKLSHSFPLGGLRGEARPSPSPPVGAMRMGTATDRWPGWGGGTTADPILAGAKRGRLVAGPVSGGAERGGMAANHNATVAHGSGTTAEPRRVGGRRAATNTDLSPGVEGIDTIVGPLDLRLGPCGGGTSANLPPAGA